MLLGQKICVIMPAYNAAKTLEKTYQEIPKDIVDRIILVDDFSQDKTVQVAKKLGLEVIQHQTNGGYGANQKTCYQAALKGQENIIIMLHPDYQYTPTLITAMAAMLASGQYDLVLGSRILGRGALLGGMPLYKYIFNRVLTLVQNILVGQKLSEYHTGYRAYRRAVLEKIQFRNNSDDFIFDNQLLVQAILAQYRIGEISCPTKYFPEASSINFRRSCKYGLGVLWTAWLGFLARKKIYIARIFKNSL